MNYCLVLLRVIYVVVVHWPREPINVGVGVTALKMRVECTVQWFSSMRRARSGPVLPASSMFMEIRLCVSALFEGNVGLPCEGAAMAGMHFFSSSGSIIIMRLSPYFLNYI
jgi:hypothetical protein